MKVKWGKELFNDVELNTDEEPVVFKAQLFALTGVQPNRQKVMIKGAAIRDESWGNVASKVKNGATLLLMGSKEEDIPKEVIEKTQFVEDMDESQLQSAMKLPAGLTNLGNTCYLNATVQCFKTVPELKEALLNFEGSLGTDESRALTSALRDLYRTMDKGQTIPPLVLVQLLHNVFPRFAERGEQGGFQQQVMLKASKMVRKTIETEIDLTGRQRMLGGIDGGAQATSEHEGCTLQVRH